MRLLTKLSEAKSVIVGLISWESTGRIYCFGDTWIVDVARISCQRSYDHFESTRVGARISSQSLILSCRFSCCVDRFSHSNFWLICSIFWRMDKM